MRFGFLQYSLSKRHNATWTVVQTLSYSETVLGMHFEMKASLQYDLSTVYLFLIVKKYTNHQPGDNFSGRFCADARRP